MLTNISRPVSLSLATMAFGACLGLVPAELAVIDKATAVPNVPITTSDLITFAVWVACAATMLIIGIYAIGGQIKAHRTLSEIRNRPSELIEKLISKKIGSAAPP